MSAGGRRDGHASWRLRKLDAEGHEDDQQAEAAAVRAKTAAGGPAVFDGVVGEVQLATVVVASVSGVSVANRVVRQLRWSMRPVA